MNQKTLKIALIGYGAMGKLVAERVRARSESGANDFEIGAIINSKSASQTFDARIALVRGHDAAIDFSQAAAVIQNIEICARAGVPLVEGTTGWNAQFDVARKIVNEQHAALVYGANFSIGVNIFYRIVQCAAELFAGFEDYAPFIEERHHARKRDAPSGTALVLRDKIRQFYERDFSISSTRAGAIPGTHTVGFDSPADTVTLTHTARTREGFADGALLAAKWIQGRRGMFEFGDVLQTGTSDKKSDSASRIQEAG